MSKLRKVAAAEAVKTAFRRGTALFLLSVFLLGSLTLAPAAQAAEPGIEWDFFQRLNSARQANGLAPLKMSTSLRGVAQRYSDRLATSSPCTAVTLVHNPNLTRDIETYVTPNRVWDGENLGCGGDVSAVHAALMASEGHRANILRAYNFVGIGVTYHQPGQFYVTFDFLTTPDNLAIDNGRSWQSLGGTLTSDPDVSSWATGRLDVFGRGSNSAIWHKWYDANRWSVWEDLGGRFVGSPTAVSWGANRVDVFGRGTDNALWHKFFDGTRWSGWQSLGGVLTSDPEVSSWAAGRLDVFARGTNNAMLHRSFSASRWSAWEDLGGQFLGGPGAVSWDANRIDVFGRGTDNALWHKNWDGTRWSGWQSLGGRLTSDPDVSSWARGRLDVFARDTNNAMVHRSYAGGWSAWKDLGGRFVGGPGAVSWGANRIDVFGRGTDNALWHKYWDGRSW